MIGLITMRGSPTKTRIINSIDYDHCLINSPCTCLFLYTAFLPCNRSENNRFEKCSILWHHFTDFQITSKISMNFILTMVSISIMLFWQPRYDRRNKPIEFWENGVHKLEVGCWNIWCRKLSMRIHPRFILFRKIRSRSIRYKNMPYGTNWNHKHGGF